VLICQTINKKHMPFFNRYIREEYTYKYNHCIRTGSAVYCAGYGYNESGMITKLDLSGNVIWEKSFTLADGIIFVRILQCTGNSDFLVIGHSYSGISGLYVFRFDQDGNIVWKKKLSNPVSFFMSNTSRFNNFIEIGNENYVFAITETTGQTRIFKFNSSGIVTASRTLTSDAGYRFNVEGIVKGPDKIALYGSSIDPGDLQKGTILELDFALNTILKEIDSDPVYSAISSPVLDLFYKGSSIIARISHEVSFFVKFNVSGSTVTMQNNKAYFAPPYINSMKYNSNHIYLEDHSDRDFSIITKLTHDFNVVWTKKFLIDHQYATGVLFDVTDQAMLLSTGNILEFLITYYQPTVALLDLNMTSCKTTNLEAAFIDYKGWAMYVAETPYTLSDWENTLVNLPNVSSPAVSSVVEVVCPDLGPCIKDPEICEKYLQLSTSFTACILKVSQSQPTPPKYSLYKSCFEAFTNELQEINTSFPQYSIVANLDYQLTAIKIFLSSKPDKGQVNFYNDAMNAVAFILEFLSMLGNCNCENVLDVTDYASIQSGNLYLQAAGSTGDDSTKGIHLRWTFRGALLQHLPKADYATTTFNFNKPNDYVKIYRTPYISNQVVLDLSQQPVQIVENTTGKFWLYEVSGKFFHVHFRNIAKYNQVRNMMVPADDLLLFIKFYGNSLIEIENKTELSFTIQPSFEIVDNSNSVKVEVLSVLENKITAAKTASLRKKFAAAELNEGPLVAENIRSIRFQAINAHPTAFKFEFYSDFILNAKESNAWQFMGKYALTKDTSLAFHRLEPLQNCLNPWLRYNDLAFVNIENYKTKWNGSAIDPMERIITSVQKYIELSNAADNIRALEYFPYVNQDDAITCNMQDPDYGTEGYEPAYDPYIPEDAGTPEAAPSSIEISYLDTLNIGALDYHIARMVGLGMLDLGDQVMDGQYMYLSEYTTFADLEDGLGDRQVQHLYCSLPTSLSDQRLCIPIDLEEPKPGFFFHGNSNGEEVDQGDDEDDDEDVPQDPYQTVELTVDGYSPDGRTRYYSLFAEPELEEQFNAPFYYTSREFIAAEHTPPVFAGLEYRVKDAGAWHKPELSYDPDYFNVDTSGINPEYTNETVSLIIPDPGFALFTHAVKQTGDMEYSSYGINWFSRAVTSERIWPVHTELKPAIGLLPPGNITATLVQKESPLLLTSAYEQLLYTDNPHADKTLVRLTFEYNTAQELIDYHQKINDEMVVNYSELDDVKELFAEKIQIFFRDEIPNSVSGKISNVINNGNPLLIVVETSAYVFASTGDTVTPVIPAGLSANFIGSVMLIDQTEYVIHEVDTSSTFPKFTLFKADVSGALIDENTVFDPAAALLVPSVGSLFIVVENMQADGAWGLPNPMDFSVNIDLDQIYREDGIIFKTPDCTTETHVQKFRGVYKEATVEKVIEKIDENGDVIIEDNPDPGTYVNVHMGLYKVTFNITEGSENGFKLLQHSQYHLDDTTNGVHSVEWYNGIARLHVISDLGITERKNFKVIRTENIGDDNNNLVLYIQDLTFPDDPALIADYPGKLMPPGNTPASMVQWVNYYPGYKVYLYEDIAYGLIKENVLPLGDEDVRYTMFGLRSLDIPGEWEYDNTEDVFSKISVPTLMFAQAIIEPMPPAMPIGGMYATRPDYFGKASYTFTTKYGTPEEHHKPYSVQFSRASDIQLLGAVYNNTPMGFTPVTNEPILNTVDDIMQNIFLNGEEAFYVNRWIDFLSFNNADGVFGTIDGKTMPLPDNVRFIESINDFIHAHNAFYHLVPPQAEPDLPVGFNLNTIVIHATPQNSVLRVMDFFKDVIFNCFVPLTEIPIIYNYVNGGDYKPIPKKQVIRDKNGELLKPEDPLFDIAPMMKRIDPVNQQYESQFTDFGLDGASNSKYFYTSREINNQMKTSDYSPIAGPISLVNTAPPIAPEIIKTIPVLENRQLGTLPQIQLQINAYPAAQNIAKVSVYRTDDPSEALSIRTMNLIRIFSLEVQGLIEESQWAFNDDFSDLPQVPYGDPLFYRMTVSRKIRYNDKDLIEVIEYAPSEASKLIITNITENYSPESPVMQYTANDYNPLTENSLNYVIFSWNETCYKGNYHLYKMNNGGNWVEIARIVANRNDREGNYEVYNQDSLGNWVNTIHPGDFDSVGDTIYMPLALTNLGSAEIGIKAPDGTPIYHHFKVIAENTAGMLSNKENILTLYDPGSFHTNGGISSDDNPDGMIVEGTFIVR
jgi:hypothetical protein